MASVLGAKRNSFYGTGIARWMAFTLVAMRRALAPVLCVFLPSLAAAEPADSNATPSHGTMAGGTRVPDAITLESGVFELAAMGGYGYRNKMLSENHTLNRAAGQLVFAYGVHDLVSIGVALDGRYDRHRGPAPSPDDGFVGDPHIFARAAMASGGLRFGGELGVFVPGNKAPSVVASAISVDIRGLASIPVGPALLSLTAGFRLDNSAHSVSDEGGAKGTGPSMLSLQDRISLGVSDFHAVLGGVRLTYPFGNAWISAEGSTDVFVGSPPTSGGAVTLGHAELANGKVTYRGAIHAGIRIAEPWRVFGFAQIAKQPGITASQIANGNIPLIPYEPMLAFGIGVAAQFGGASNRRESLPDHPCDTANDDASVESCPSEPILATISGVVKDETDKPVVGAQVTVKLKGAQPLVVTDSTGSYKVEVQIGKRFRTRFHGDVTRIAETAAQIDIVVDGKKPASTLLVKLTQGANYVEPIKLESQLPAGQLRGVVRAVVGGKTIGSAAITITPGDHSVTTAADGTFSVDLAPGTYKVSVKAKGFSVQELNLTIEPNGVVIKNIDLTK